MKIRQFEMVGILLIAVSVISDAASINRILFGIGLGLSFQMVFRFFDAIAAQTRSAIEEAEKEGGEKL